MVIVSKDGTITNRVSVSASLENLGRLVSIHLNDSARWVVHLALVIGWLLRDIHHKAIDDPF